jgi:hypothetical protein
VPDLPGTVIEVVPELLQRRLDLPLRATRSISRIPAARSLQWWSVKIAIAASTLPSSRGSASAEAWTAGALPGGRWAIITAEGSTATTSRSAGS